MTTTIWRPKVRIDVPDVGDVDDKDTSREESTKKGTKRKRAPSHNGPCEHGVKTSLEVQGCAVGVRTVVSALSARSAVGQEYASTVVYARSARSAVGQKYASTVVGALNARSAVGHKYASTVVSAHVCKECGGASICEHGRERSQCKECGGCINLRARS